MASDIVSMAAFKKGLDVKKSEVHGMAQRGGAVVSQVRFGLKIYSPLIRRGEADILLAFEEAEGLRWIHYLKGDGTLIVNMKRIVPPITYVRGGGYPSEPVKEISSRVADVRAINAPELASRLGDQRLANTILLGVLSTRLDFTDEEWREAIRESVPPSHVEANLKAFSMGKEHIF